MGSTPFKLILRLLAAGVAFLLALVVAYWIVSDPWPEPHPPEERGVAADLRDDPAPVELFATAVDTSEGTPRNDLREAAPVDAPFRVYAMGMGGGSDPETQRIPQQFASRALELTRSAGQALTLAGDSAGTADWSLDGFLLLESFVDDQFYSSIVLGDAPPLLNGTGDNVQPFGPAGADFAAGEINIASIVPADVPTRLRASLLDFDGAASVTSLWITVEAVALPPDSAGDQP